MPEVRKDSEHPRFIRYIIRSTFSQLPALSDNSSRPPMERKLRRPALFIVRASPRQDKTGLRLLWRKTGQARGRSKQIRVLPSSCPASITEKTG